MRCKNFILIPDAETLILEVNDNPVRIFLCHGEKCSLDELKALYPKAERPAQLSTFEIENAPVNGNVASEAPVKHVRTTKIAMTPTPVPDGWKVFEAYDIKWAENPATHKPLGPSDTCTVKTLGKKVTGKDSDKA